MKSTNTSYQMVGIPCLECSPAYLSYATVGGNTTDFIERSFDLDVEPGAANFADGYGRLPVTVHGVGRPSAALDMDVASSQVGAPNLTAGYRFSADGGTTWQGWVPGTNITGAETVVYSDADGFVEPTPSPVVLDDGTVYLVALDVANLQLNAFSRTVAGVWSDGGALLDAAGQPLSCGGVGPAAPAIVRLPNGGIVLGFLDTNTADSHLEIYYSADRVTWYRVGHRVVTLDATMGKVNDWLVMTYDEVAQVLTAVIRCTDGGTVTGRSYTSADHGATWVAGTTWTILAHGMVSWAGVTVYVYTKAADNVYHVVRKSSASNAWVDLGSTGTGVDQTEMTLVVRPNGWISIYGRGTAGAANEIQETCSPDRGETWGSVFHPDYDGVVTPPDEGGASGLILRSGCFVKGWTLLPGNLTTAAGVDATIMAYRFGEHNTVTMGEGSTLTYVPADLPAARGWTPAGAGAQVITSDGTNLILDISTVVGIRSYAFTGVANECQVRARLTPLSGGSVASDDLAIKVRLTNGAGTDYVDLRLRFDAAGSIQLYDANAAAAIGAVQAFTAGDTIEVLLAVSPLFVSWWFLVGGLWVNVVDGVAPTQAVGVQDDVTWGHITAGNTDSEWLFLDVKQDSQIDDLPFGQPDPVALLAVPACLSAGTNVLPWLVTDTVGLTWRGAPVMAGDTYNVKTVSREGMARALPSRVTTSPRQNYVGGVDPLGGTTYHALFDLGADYYSRLGDLVGLAVRDTNVASVSLSRWTGAAWSIVAGLVLLDNPWGGAGAVAWTRNAAGSLDIVPNGTNGTPKYYAEDELKGCLIILGDGGGNTFYGTIARNSEGQGSNASGVKQMRITVAETPLPTTPDPITALATSTNTGTLQIYWPDGVAVGAQAADTRYYLLTWVAALGETPKFGKLIPFRGLLFGRSEDTGGQWTNTANDTLITYPSGIMRGRRQGPASRVVRFPYRGLYHAACQRYAGGTAAPSTGPGAVPRAVVDNNGDLAEWLIGYVGQTRPIVFAPECDFADDPGTSTYTLLGSRRWLWGFAQDEAVITLASGQRFGITSGHHESSLDWIVREAT